MHGIDSLLDSFHKLITIARVFMRLHTVRAFRNHITRHDFPINMVSKRNILIQ